MIELLSQADSQPSFWASVFPDYLGAVSGILSAVVALIAFLQSLRNKAGVRQLADGLNEQATAKVLSAPEGSAESAAVVGGLDQPANPASGTRSRFDQPWTIVRAGGKVSVFRLTNTADRSLVLLNILGRNGGMGVSKARAFPTTIEPKETLGFDVARGNRGSTVNPYDLRWQESDGEIRSTEFYF